MGSSNRRNFRRAGERVARLVLPPQAMLAPFHTQKDASLQALRYDRPRDAAAWREVVTCRAGGGLSVELRHELRPCVTSSAPHRVLAEACGDTAGGAHEASLSAAEHSSPA